MNFRCLLYSIKSGGSARSLARELAGSQSLSAGELAALNFRRRLDLVRHCQLNVPYYQKRFGEEGIHWEDIRTEIDFARLPILEKSDVRTHQADLVANTVRRVRLRPATTGGTTGEPLTIFSDPEVPLSAMTWRMLAMWGVDVSDNSGYLYRAVPHGLRKHLSDLVLYPTRRAYLAAAGMNRVSMERFHAELLRIKPAYLVGYVGALDAFADFLKQENRGIPSLKVIWTTAAPLPELKRQYLREVFGCPVYTQYGCVETFMIAAESPEKNGLYVYSDIRHVEIVNGGSPANPGDLGDVVVTDLTNHAFPLLRYRLGDQSRLLARDPDAKLPFPRMDYVRGRISDNIRLPDGTAIAGEFWTTIFDDFPDDIKSFQILQTKDYGIEVAYEPKSLNCQRAIDKVRNTLETRMLNSVPITFVKRTIDNNENGKTRFVRSEITG